MPSKPYLFGVDFRLEKAMKRIPLRRHLWHIKLTRKASFSFHFHPSKTPLESLGFPREKRSSKLGQIISFLHPKKWHKTDVKLKHLHPFSLAFLSNTILLGVSCQDLSNLAWLFSARTLEKKPNYFLIDHLEQR